MFSFFLLSEGKKGRQSEPTNPSRSSFNPIGPDLLICCTRKKFSQYLQMDKIVRVVNLLNFSTIWQLRSHAILPHLGILAHKVESRYTVLMFPFINKQIIVEE